MNLPTLALMLALGLALVHIFSGKLRFLEGIPRSRWLSIAGGISVAYVFVHLLPELSAGQQAIERAGILAYSFLERHVYILALLGLTVFYGLERSALDSRQRQQSVGKGDTPGKDIFWLHLVSFSIYNLLIGYLLLHRETPGVQSLLLFAFAMGVHFVVNDFGLRERFQAAYHQVGRWAFAVAVLAGWGLGTATEIQKALVSMLFAFLAGGVVLNILKEELPAERRSRFWPFLIGAAAYTVVLLLF